MLSINLINQYYQSINQSMIVNQSHEQSINQWIYRGENLACGLTEMAYHSRPWRIQENAYTLHSTHSLPFIFSALVSCPVRFLYHSATGVRGEGCAGVHDEHGWIRGRHRSGSVNG